MTSWHKYHRYVALWVALISALFATPHGWGAEEQDARADAFREQIEPILVGRCLECHGGDRKGDLDLRRRDSALVGGESGVVIVPGDADESLLIQHVFFEEMPPEHPLSDEEVEALERWIEDGAYFPETPLDLFSVTTGSRGGYDWWSLQPLLNTKASSAFSGLQADDALRRWLREPIDRYILANLKENGLRPSRPASSGDLIRRATYDLTGLPPTLEEVEVFRAACESETGRRERVGETAYEALLDRLLASPRYGEQWGRHWLDVIRFGESTGFEVNHIIDDAWPFRDYIIDSFNDDKPFDQLIAEHIAGDTIAPGDPDVEIGLGFLVAGPHDIVGNQDPAQAAQIRANSIDEIIRATGESFLGLTVGCARCHDHKFDPISQADYYRMYATFAGVYPESRTVATESQRSERKTKLEPLETREAELLSNKGEIEEAILARADTKVDEYAERWPREPVSRQGTEETFEPVVARYLRLHVKGRDSNPYDDSGYKIDEFEVWTDGAEPKNVAAASNGGHAEGKSAVAQDFGDAYLADLTIDERFGESWLARESKLTITFAKPERITRVLFSSDRPGALAPDSGQSPFTCEYIIEISEDGENWSQVADSYDRAPVNEKHRRKRFLDIETTDEESARLDELEVAVRAVKAEISKVPGFRTYRVGRMSQPKEAAHVFLGGDPQRLGDEVSPASPDALRAAGLYQLDSDAPESERRAELSRWLVGSGNPLTPRVLANRIWHYHFGTGLVSTPSDFGFMGGRPSHPELLDWLARELVEPRYGLDSSDDNSEHAWRLKRMHKMIMLSQAYRRSSEFQPGAGKVDAESRLLWRFPPRRLTGEELRDSMLAVSGQLDTRMGGPGFRLYRYIRDNVASYIPLDEYGPETYRRTVYHQNVRASRIDLMTDFDAPDCARSTPRRVTTTTPLQALTLMNHDFTMDMAEALVARIAAGNDKSGDRGAVEQAYRLVLGRAPVDDEIKIAVALVDDYGLRALCRALFNANEFVYLN